MAGPIVVAALAQLAVAARFGLGLVFLLSALPKLRRPPTFVRSVVAYEVLPTGVARIFASALIPTEVLLAFAFLTGWWPAVALPLGAAVLLAFLAAVGINLRRGRRIPCGCFGEASESISPRTVARLLLLLIVVLLLIASGRASAAASPGLGSIVTDTSTVAYLLETASLAAALIVLATWLLHLPEAISLARRLRSSRPPLANSRAGGGMEGR